jgi:O-antigen ligase
MSSFFYPAVRQRFAIPIVLGAWVAAIAVAPNLWAKLALAAPAVLVPLALWTLESPGRWMAGFIAAALLLPPLPIALGDSGPHLCLLFAGLGLLAGLIGAGRWRVPATGLNCALAALLVILLASVAPAALNSGGFVAAGSLARVALFAIAVYAFFFTAYGPGAASVSFGALPWLYWTAAASALFACVDFYFQFPAPAGFGAQFVWLDSGVYRRAQGVFYDAGTLGNFCAFFLVMIAVALAHTSGRKPVSRKALAVGGAVFLGALILSYSRSSVLNVVAALMALAWLHRKRLRMVRSIATLTAGVGLGALLTWKLFPQFFEAYWQRISGSAEFFLVYPEAVLSGRLASWQTLTNWISAHPWQSLVGIGYKTLPYTDYLGAPVVGDNMYLSLLVETGVLGLGALLWLNVAILRTAARAARATDSNTAFIGAWMLCFWCGQMVQMLSVDLLTFWRVLPLYFWVLALAVRA